MDARQLTPQELATFETLLRIIAHLRSPQGCPWDREQTHQSLKRNLLEESHEVLEAIDQNDSQRLAEELGDILVQVAFHTQMAQEAGTFRAADMLTRVNQKLIRRHPHVFGDASAAKDANEVELRWEELKRKERPGGSLLGSLPRELPALAYAQLMQDRAAKAKFDWEDVAGVLEKVAEEVRELKEAPDPAARSRELGDLLFSIVNLARWLNVHAEDALRQANARFNQRFEAMERLCRERGLDFVKLSLDEKEALWQEAKSKEAP
jgi:tetrapyrrole methylase family protein/MazG family protein